SKPNDPPTKEAIVEKSPAATEPAKTVSAPPPTVTTNIDSPTDVPEKPKVVKEIKTVSKPAEQTGSSEKAVLAMPANQPVVKTSNPPAHAVSPSQIKNPEVTPVPVAPESQVDSSATKT